MKISGEEQTGYFFDALKVLEEDGSLFFDKKKGYRILTNDLGFAYGEIEINKEGTGFVHTKDGYKIIIDSQNLNGALNGDYVLISSIEYGKRNDFKGEVYKVLKRKDVKKGTKTKTTSFLEMYGRDLTKLALFGKINNVIGREKETNRILQNLEEYQTYNDVDSMMIDILSEK